MYAITVITANDVIAENIPVIDGYFRTKREVIRVVSKVIGETQREVASEIRTQADSFIARDRKGIRVKVEWVEF